MPSITGGFQIKGGQMTEESRKKFEAVAGDIGAKLGLRPATVEELTTPKEVESISVAKEPLLAEKPKLKKKK